jgi:hypothetical protein
MENRTEETKQTPAKVQSDAPKPKLVNDNKGIAVKSDGLVHAYHDFSRQDFSDTQPEPKDKHPDHKTKKICMIYMKPESK